MQNFEFYNPVKIFFGKGEIAKLSDAIDKNKKVLLIYGGGSIKKNGVYDQKCFTKPCDRGVFRD